METKICRVCSEEFTASGSKTCVKCRLNGEAAKEARRIIPSHDYDIPKVQLAALDKELRTYTDQIRSELGSLSSKDEDAITAAVATVVGTEHKFFRRVSDPSGVLVLGGFPDSRVALVVKHVHRQPRILESSATFQSLYTKFLQSSLKLSQKYAAFFDAGYR